jgi:tetratricopeptide (TPR) repeat protein
MQMNTNKNIENEEDKQEVTKLKVTCHLNMAACYLKMEKEKEAIQECSSALKIEPNNVKALFRRGRAYMEEKEWEKAEEDFNKSLEMDKDNIEIKNELVRLAKKKQEQDKKDKSIFGGLFKRGHLYEDKSVANLPFWNRFTSTIFSPGITQEQITVMNFVFIALFVTTTITIIFSKSSIHLFVLLGIALFLFLAINWFIASTHPEKPKGAKDEKTE